jgi:hypothetical protein
MFREPPRPSSGVYNCINSLWFYRWSVVVAALLVVVWPVITGQTTTNNAFADQGELLNFGIGGLVVSLAGIMKWFRFVISDLTFVTAVVNFSGWY